MCLKCRHHLNECSERKRRKTPETEGYKEKTGKNHTSRRKLSALKSMFSVSDKWVNGEYAPFDFWT